MVNKGSWRTTRTSELLKSWKTWLSIAIVSLVLAFVRRLSKFLGTWFAWSHLRIESPSSSYDCLEPIDERFEDS